MARDETQEELIPSDELASDVFSQFLGQAVKVPYRDGRQLKVARGTLVSAAGSFVKIDGSLGTIIINVRNIEKMSRLSEHEHNEHR